MPCFPETPVDVAVARGRIFIVRRPNRNIQHVFRAESVDGYEITERDGGWYLTLFLGQGQWQPTFGPCAFTMDNGRILFDPWAGL